MQNERTERILSALQKSGISQMLVTDPMSIYYMTGIYIQPFERFFGYYITAEGENVLFLNNLFTIPDGIDIRQVWFSDTDPVTDILVKYIDKSRVLGIDKTMAARFLLPLMQNKAAAGFQLTSLAVDMTRAVKDEEEKALMRRASQINDAAMARFKGLIHEGVTELEVESHMLQIYKDLGSDGYSFPPIVSFGANAADPHHGPDGTILAPGQMVLFDVGCKRQAYCSDMTRTFFTAAPTAHQLEVYDTVRRANEAAEAKIRPGVEFAELDLTARKVIEDAGYGKYFTHRLGHQIGLTDHEPGDVSSTHHEPVQPGMCFSIEPGIYIPGDIGVRIEDLAIVTEDGAEILNHFTHEPTVLTAD